MTEKIEPEWQKEIPLRCRHCDGCRDISSLAYLVHQLERRNKDLEAENLYQRIQIKMAIERSGKRVDVSLERLSEMKERRRCG